MARADVRHGRISSLAADSRGPHADCPGDAGGAGGITIAPPGALQQVERGTLGIRLCLGHPTTDEILENALFELKRILESAEAFSFV